MDQEKNIDRSGQKVMIACPTLGLDPDPDRWLTTLLRIINDIRRHGMGHACFFPYKDQWWPANNSIWDAALQYGFDYILRIDDDVWGAPPNAFSMLLAADVDVIGASYPIRQFPYSMCAFTREDKAVSMIDSWKTREENPSAMHEIKGQGVQECELVGFGMTLIKLEKFRTMERPIYKGVQVCPDDTYFAQLCLDRGIKQHVHMDVKLCHRDVTPLNRVYLFNAEARMLINQGAIKRGNKFYDILIETFGEDGMKDFDQLKGVEVSKILVPRKKL